MRERSELPQRAPEPGSRPDHRQDAAPEGALLAGHASASAEPTPRARVGEGRRVRSFIAILLDDAIRAAVAAEVDHLKPLASSVAWIPPQNLHLTLKFLGEVEAEALETVKEALAEGASSAAPFTLAFHGLGAFPGLARPRVVWVGVSQGARECRALQAAVDEALARRRFPKEARPYTPHLTVARVRAPRGLAALQQAIGRNAQKDFGAQSVRSVSLMRSDLHPAGARYTELYTVPLGSGR